MTGRRINSSLELIVLEDDLDNPYYAKKCTKCNEVKCVEEFWRNGKDYHSRCISCFKIDRELNKNPLRDRDYDLRSKYNITLDEYNKMYLNQEGKCAICNKVSERLDVDHDHVTEKVRELLCTTCDKGIGQLQDDILVLEKAIEYIKKHRK